MATAYGTAVQYNEYISPINTALVDSVMNAKSQAYDANMAKVDAMLGQYKGLDFARAEDKQKMAESLQNLTNTLNTSAKLDLSNNNTVRQINNSISSTLTDDLKLQLVNTANIRKFEQEMSDKKKKGDGTYSDINYTDAKELAGYNDYMKGYDKDGNKVDTLGSLNYVDYYDIDGNTRKALNEWAKNIGITENVEFNTNPDNPYEYEQVKIKSLTKEQIGRFFDTFTEGNPQAMTQMQINSRQMFKGYSDEEFKKEYDSKKDGLISNLNSERLAVVESMKKFAKDSPNYKEGEATLGKYDTAITRIKESPYDRGSAQMSFYNENLKTSYQDAYSFKSITNIDRPNPMELKKFEMELKKFEYEFGDGQGLQSGTPFEVNTEQGQELEGTNIADMLKSKVVLADDNLRTHLNNTNSDYRNADERGKEAILNQLTKDVSVNNINKPIDPTLKRLAQERLDAESAYAVPMNKARDVANQVANNLFEEISKSFKGETSDLNINSLASSMPKTVALIRKGGNLESSSPSEKVQILHEISGNAKNTLVQHPVDKKMLELAEESYANEAKALGISLKPKEQGSLLGEVGTIASLAGNALKDVFMLPFIRATQGEEATYNYAEGRKGFYSQSFDDLNKQRLTRNPLDILTPDTNLGSLQGRDLQGKGAYKIASDILETSRKDFTDLLESGVPTMTKSRGISFNPNDKKDKQPVLLAENILKANGITPSKDTSYNVFVDNGEVKIEFNKESLELSKSGAQRKIVTKEVFSEPINESNIGLLRQLDIRTPSYAYSVNNPNPLNHSYVYSIPKTVEDKVTTVNNLLNMVGTSAKKGFNQSALNTIKTVADYQPLLDLANTPEKQARAREVINSEYGVKVSRVTGQKFIYNVTRNGNTTSYNMETREYTPEEGVINSATLINQAISQELAKITM